MCACKRFKARPPLSRILSKFKLKGVAFKIRIAKSLSLLYIKHHHVVVEQQRQ